VGSIPIARSTLTSETICIPAQNKRVSYRFFRYLCDGHSS
jgi:hypothetical protein